MKRKFKLEWINVPGVRPGYNEVWSQDDIKYDFGQHTAIMDFTKKSKKGKSYIVFDHAGTGFLIITRISSNSKIKTQE